MHVLLVYYVTIILYSMHVTRKRIDRQPYSVSPRPITELQIPGVILKLTRGLQGGHPNSPANPD